MPFQEFVLNYGMDTMLSKRTTKQIVQKQNLKYTAQCSRRKRFLF